MKNILTEYRWLVSFTMGYLLVAAYFYLSRGNWEFIAYLGVTVLVGLLSFWQQARRASN